MSAVPRGFADTIRGPTLEQPQERESIWTVSKPAREIYFVVFVSLFLAGMGLVAVRSFGEGGSLIDITIGVWSEAAPLTITAAAAALALTEIGRSIVVIAQRLQEGLERVRRQRREEGRREGLAEGREEGLAEGREEGLAKANEAWRSWNERRVAAETRGEPFTEPPPEFPD